MTGLLSMSDEVLKVLYCRHDGIHTSAQGKRFSGGCLKILIPNEEID